MDFDQMLPVLQSQASRIFNGNKDKMQDVLAMAYLNFNSCLTRKRRQLSIGELTNFIKYRATELNNGKRPHFGNVSAKRTNDVYFKLAYLNSDVERLSFDFSDETSEEGDQGFLAFQTRIPSKEDDILFNIDFVKFCKRLDKIDKAILEWSICGLNPAEISQMLQLKYSYIRTRLKIIRNEYCSFFQLCDITPAIK